jgi:hypothetical protein
MERAMTTVPKRSMRKLSCGSVDKSRCEKQLIIWDGCAVSPPVIGENNNIRISTVMHNANIRQEQAAEVDPDQNHTNEENSPFNSPAKTANIEVQEPKRNSFR